MKLFYVIYSVHFHTVHCWGQLAPEAHVGRMILCC